MTKNEQMFQMITDLSENFGELRGEMNTGFAGVNKRLDTLNGKVAEHEKRLNTDDNRNSFNDGKSVATKYILGLILSIAALIVAILFHQ